jgi:Dictyostelium (slime mold) repeat
MRLVWIALAASLGLLAGQASAAGNAKVQICHIPPGNPANFHTITISENALPAHLAHGDLGEPCNAVCDVVCDDGNACTIGDSTDCEQQGCPADPALVDCNDQSACTADSCDPLTGCVNTPLVGAACDDGVVCSGPDVCNADGVCTGAAIDDCCLSDTDCSSDPCQQASCNLDTNRCGAAPVVCIPPDLCTVSSCRSDTGECENVPLRCRPGFGCNPTNGLCEPSCFPSELFETSCFDGSDNDCDGLIDADDPDCAPGPPPEPTPPPPPPPK